MSQVWLLYSALKTKIIYLFGDIDKKRKLCLALTKQTIILVLLTIHLNIAYITTCNIQYTMYVLCLFYGRLPAKKLQTVKDFIQKYFYPSLKRLVINHDLQ